jgi:hypothetical protein
MRSLSFSARAAAMVLVTCRRSSGVDAAGLTRRIFGARREKIPVSVILRLREHNDFAGDDLGSR